jgi:SHS2 domain-containing protein
MGFALYPEDCAMSLAERRHEHFRHDADIGVRGLGPTAAAAFEEAALAMTAVVTDPQAVAPRDTICVACEAPALDFLFADWLNALIFEMSTRGMVFSSFSVDIQGDRLVGEASGELVDVARHQPAVEIKGATLTDLSVKQLPDGAWMAQCVVDV